MPSYREHKATQIAFLSEQLQTVDARLSDTHNDLADAFAVLSRAQDAVAMLRQNIQNLDDQRAHIQRSITEFESQIDPALMRSLPTELLTSVFVEFVSIRTTPLREGCHILARYDHFKAKAPWILASVSRRWRELALLTPSLWTYIGLPGNIVTEQIASRAMLYVFDLLCRSGRVPLDICIDWEEEEWLEDTHAPIFDTLTPVISRWRSCFFGLPNEAGSPERMEVFRRSTPLLEELVACIDDDSVVNPWHVDFPQYLPDGPRLRTMRTDGCHVIWRAPLPALRHLELQVDLPPHIVWEMLLHAPLLEKLMLQVDQEPAPWTTTAPTKLCLPHLKYLELYMWAAATLDHWPDLLDLPALTTLVTTLSPQDRLAAIARQAGGVTTLHYDVQSTDHSAVAVLTKVKTLVVKSYLSNTSVASKFFDNISSEVWPAMEDIHLQGLIFTPEAAEALLRLVRSRVSGSRRRLQNIRFEACDCPEWLVEQVGRLVKTLPEQ